MRRRAYTILLVLMGAFFAVPAFASGPLSVDTSGGMAPAFGDGNHGGYADIWTPTDVITATSTQVYFSSITGGPRVALLQVGTGGYASSDIASATSSCMSSAWCTFSFAQKTFSAGTTYYFTISDPNTSGNNFIPDYGNGNATGARNSFGAWSGVSPIAMQMPVPNYTPSAPTLTLDYPVSQVDSDFSHWHVMLTLPAGYTGQLGVRYATSSPPTKYSDLLFGQTYEAQTGQGYYISKSQQAPYATSSLWYAQAVFVDASGNVIATSTITSFRINGWSVKYTGASQPASYTPTSTAGVLLGPDDPTSFWYVDCSAYSTLDPAGWFCSAKKSALWLAYNLVVPHSQFSGYWTWSLNTFRGAFPFNVGFAFLDDIRSAVEGTSVVSADLYLPVYGKQVKVFDRTAIEGIMGTDNFMLIYNVMGYVIWTMLMFTIYLEGKALLKK